jgi:hypothetical protein
MDDFKKYCSTCGNERLPSSSNAKFEVDYCSHCKEVTNFSSTKEDRKESVAKEIINRKMNTKK